MSTIGRSIALLALTIATAAPVAADPISFGFSTTVTQAFGPVEDLFGRTFVRGDLLSGHVTIDPAALGSHDFDPRESVALFGVGIGRVVFDVPSGFSMDASSIGRFVVVVQNSAPGTTEDYAQVDLMDTRSDSPGFDALLIRWIDPSGRALSSTAWPTTLDGLSVTELRFNGFRGQTATGNITLLGDSPAPVVPEPGTIALVAGGLVTTVCRARRRRSHA